MAKCVKYYDFGKPQDVLKVENRHVQNPGPGKILVRMITSPINPSDLIPIYGSYSHRIFLPAIPGYEGVGVVEEVGPAVPKELLGKRVLPLRGEGTWQNYVRASAELAIPIPVTIDNLTAAQLYINPVTAWIICKEILELKPGDALLVNACSSSIGRIFAQLSKILGFELIAAVRNDIHTKDLIELGASYVINTSESSLVNMVRELTNGRGVSAAIDSIGGSCGNELACCLKPSGIFLSIGLLSGKPVDWKIISQKGEVKLFHLRHWNKQVSVKKWHETFEQLISYISEKKLKLMPPYEHYDLIHVKEAVLAVESLDTNRGKVFLKSELLQL
ncbi:zinc-dependent alcohol dehydrogenase family protein [Lederbergia wuyishanensis]|uniref:NADPH:quinone reductase-like Zn-dependent oxidoreductase n=1 Tax=Lederbergia wuyishanensis TaxID=1347903 RepID=A0ABU0D6E5_9BACI|nr:zinc-dependent alcohol dehydrogenase family protein [Lederbergia wuyishanensis]MCJ8008598.1 zinc-dependent alcohol dehydrogenase family protein [Lederbergia wuyishanensis]MDQ0343986.1 NADPH:quinone reductase-like Zn-dependent oxidoreductase [Lederbergia wuyishanensis]